MGNGIWRRGRRGLQIACWYNATAYCTQVRLILSYFRVSRIGYILPTTDLRLAYATLWAYAGLMIVLMGVGTLHVI